MKPNYAYIIIRGKILWSMGYAHSLGEIRQIFRNLAGYSEKWEGEGCYGYTFTTDEYQAIAWKNERNGFADVDKLMAYAHAELNHGGMIKSHNEE